MYWLHRVLMLIILIWPITLCITGKIELGDLAIIVMLGLLTVEVSDGVDELRKLNKK